MHETASPLVTIGILALSLIMATVFVLVVRAVSTNLARTTAITAVVVALWMAGTGAASFLGAFLDFDARPPPFAILFALTIAGGVAVGLSPLGRRIAEGVPLFVLVMMQSFRFPLELVMHRAAHEGTMPWSMSYSGYNFDVVTGALAFIVGLFLWRGAPRVLAMAFNAVGIVTLTVIAVVSFLASPIVRAFGDDQVNTWVAYFPFVWLPTVLVLFAIVGHVTLTRALFFARPKS